MLVSEDKTPKISYYDKVFNFFNHHSAICMVVVFFLSCISMNHQLKVGISHPKLITEIVKIFFNFIALNAALLFTIKNLLYFVEKKNIYFQLFLTLFICALIFNPVVQFNPVLNDLVYIFYPTPLTSAILDDAAAIPWAFVVVGINVIIGIILFIMDKRKTIGISKITHYGLLTYGFLSIAVWFFTHFSYVGSNYIYMANNMKMIDSLIENHVNNGITLPKEFNYHVYDSYEQLKYQTIIESQKDFLEDKKYSPNLKESKNIKILNNWFNMVQSHKLGLYEDPEMSKKEVRDFSSWVFFVFNFPQNKVSKDKWIAMDLIFADKENSKTALIKHGLFYVKIHNQKYYTYVEFNKTFKENKQNLIFNLAYTFFHFIYWAFLIYLIRHHEKNVFKTKKLQEAK